MEIYPESGQTGYVLKLSIADTEKWATRPGASWPCSALYGHAVLVAVDGNGLCGLTIDGFTSTNTYSLELEAIVADHLPDNLHHLWPLWKEVSNSI